MKFASDSSTAQPADLRQWRGLPMASPSGLMARVLGCGALVTVEILVILLLTRHADTGIQASRIQLVSNWIFAQWAGSGAYLRIAIAVTAVFFTFGLLTARPALERISRQFEGVSISRRLLAWHFAALLAFGTLSQFLFGQTLPTAAADWLQLGWLATGISAFALAGLAALPFKLLLELVRSTRNLLILSVIAGFVGGWAENFRQILWRPLIGATINLVAILLRPLVADLTVDRTTGTFATHHFFLVVTPGCTGLEGAGMMLAFVATWIWVLRRECRFPRVLLLIPVSIAVVWLLNSFRLAALFLIGNAGAPDVAMIGFHSQAGWIAFSGVALGCTLVLQRVPGFTKSTTQSARSTEHSGWENPTSRYLAPFLCVLAAGMVSRAASAGFEWLYPLRFFVAAFVLWRSRQFYTRLNWRIGWPGLVIGCAAFTLWLGLDAMTPHTSSNATAIGLASLGTSAKVGWIVIRFLSASVTVPLAEELAFRGYFARRLISEDFEQVMPANLTWPAVLISSVGFGILHGQRWIAGTIAGVLYALAFRLRGRIGDAVAAHAITNLLLSGVVLVGGDWQLW